MIISYVQVNFPEFSQLDKVCRKEGVRIGG